MRVAAHPEYTSKLLRAASADPAITADAATEENEDGNDKQVDWLDQWYAVSFVRCSAEAALGTQLMGIHSMSNLSLSWASAAQRVFLTLVVVMMAEIYRRTSPMHSR